MTVVIHCHSILRRLGAAPQRRTHECALNGHRHLYRALHQLVKKAASKYSSEHSLLIALENTPGSLLASDKRTRPTTGLPFGVHFRKEWGRRQGAKAARESQTYRRRIDFFRHLSVVCLFQVIPRIYTRQRRAPLAISSCF